MARSSESGDKSRFLDGAAGCGEWGGVAGGGHRQTSRQTLLKIRRSARPRRSLAATDCHHHHGLAVNRRLVIQADPHHQENHLRQVNRVNRIGPYCRPKVQEEAPKRQATED
ncbi:hypothetical protein PF008_g26654 [Phytophthora fragariae]|uniref:Uncharacterized protein n=1 Tax=Phytophthora fragariae TaxID=53985 RepID=A0A6G0QGE4_9STRA|nr:hypothetical protein PF008_g26654 [Phytophthora fragariae]